MNLLMRMKEERSSNIRAIYYTTQVQMAYNSNKIEGSRLSAEQTQHLFDTGQLIAKSEEVIVADDIIEAINHFKAFDFILDTADEPLTSDYIKRLHYILKQSTSDTTSSVAVVGEFKKYPNVIGTIGEIQTTPPEQVEIEIDALNNNYENTLEQVTLETITDYHVRFEKIHPFSDGNGRVGRLIMFKECLRHDVTPFILLEGHRNFYYQGLQEYYETGKKRLLETFGASQDSYKAFLKEMRFLDN